MKKDRCKAVWNLEWFQVPRKILNKEKKTSKGHSNWPNKLEIVRCTSRLNLGMQWWQLRKEWIIIWGTTLPKWTKGQHFDWLILKVRIKYPVNQISFFSVRTFWIAASPCPVDLTKPEIVTILDFPRLIVPSELT